MPMLDLTVPRGAFTKEVEDALITKLTDLLLLHEGADPAHPVARSLAWVFVHHSEALFVGGKTAAAPHYRVQASVPEGQFDDERRAKMVEAITSAILDAEAGAHPRDPYRVWVFTNEVPDGTWGAGGRIHRLADIIQLVIGNPEKARAYADRRIAQSRAGRLGKA